MGPTDAAMAPRSLFDRLRRFVDDLRRRASKANPGRGIPG
jgi:hypothetical protein